MADKISRTAYEDAPLSSAHHPDATAANEQGLQAHAGDSLVGRTVSINRPRQELYEFWRDFRNLPRFMENIQSVSVSEGGSSHWVVTGPAGRKVEWDAVLTEERPGSILAWQSQEGADVRNSGRVEFTDSSNGRGTIVTATIVYNPPGGGLGKVIAKLFEKEPQIRVRRDLRRFKQLMEAGEIATSTPPNPAPDA
jgi:uncharacterized membrane protein